MERTGYRSCPETTAGPYRGALELLHTGSRSGKLDDRLNLRPLDSLWTGAGTTTSDYASHPGGCGTCTDSLSAVFAVRSQLRSPPHAQESPSWPYTCGWNAVAILLRQRSGVTRESSACTALARLI